MLVLPQARIDDEKMLIQLVCTWVVPVVFRGELQIKLSAMHGCF